MRDLRTNRGNIVGNSLLLVLAAALAATAANAKDVNQREPRRNGFYVGVGFSRVDLGGDFNGSNIVTDGYTAAAMPGFDAGTGTKWILGYQWERSEFEMAWESTRHEGDLSGFRFPGRYRALIFDGRRLWRNGIRPYVVYGLEISAVEVGGGWTDGYDVADARFKGVALRFGGGVQFPISQRVSVQAQGVYRWGSYGSVSGVGSGRLADPVNANGMSYTVDARFVFGKGKKKRSTT